MTKAQKEEYVAQLTAEMKKAASRLDFELAATLRDKIAKIQGKKKEIK
jgi:excinuclease UvrABC helicase subunit UvrB